jgi:hypothetical protein
MKGFAFQIKITLEYEIARTNNDPGAAANSGTYSRVQE